MRHAKSSWDETGLEDHDRSLNERGRADAQHMAARIAEALLTPATILSSSARRARQTAELLLDVWPDPPDVVFYNELYQSSPAQYVKILTALSQPAATPIMIVGHNPEIEEILWSACGERQAMKAATVAVLQFDLSSWTEMKGSTQGTLVEIWRAKDKS